MLSETDSFHQGFDIAAQHLEDLRRGLDLLPDRQGALKPALDGLAEALLALKQAHEDLSGQNHACAARRQDLETELACYRDLFENALHPRLLTDVGGAIQSANAAAAILLGTSPDALTGTRLAAFLPEEARRTLPEHLAQLRAGGTVRNWQLRLQPASGDPVDVCLDAVPVHGYERQLAGLQWLMRDITRQVQAEQALRESEDLLRSFVEQSFDGIALTDEQGRVIEWNHAMEQITGFPATEVIGQPIWDVQLQVNGAAGLAEEARAEFTSRFLALLSSGQAPWLGRLLERTYAHPDGSSRVLQGGVFPFRTRKGFMLGSISRDVTDLKRAEEESERLLAEATRDRQLAEESAAAAQRERDTLQAVMESTQAQVAYLDRDFNFLMVNTAYVDSSRHDKEELIGRSHFELFPNPENQAIFERVRDTGQPEEYHAKPFEFAGQPERGVTYWDWTLAPVKSSTGEVEGLVLSLHDVTRQVRDRQVLESLRAQAQRQAEELGAILNAIPDAVAVWDAQGRVLRANPAAVALGIAADQTGMVEVAARLEVRHANGCPISAEELPVARALHGEVIRNETEILVNPAGEEREILVSVAPVFSGSEIVACVVVSHDVTDKRRAEKERERLLTENRSQRGFLERLLEAAPVGIAVLRGAEHRYDLANPYYRAMTGAPDRPIIGRTIVEAIPNLPARGMPALMDQVYHTGRTVSTREVQLSIGPGREETYWNTDRVPLRGPGGTVEGILVLAHDVTREVLDRRRIEALSAEAQQQAAEMETVFAAMVDPMVVYDAAGTILRANPAATESLGLDPTGLPATVVGQNASVRHSDGRPMLPDDLIAARALRGETVRDEPELIVRSHGDERAIVASAAPIVTDGRVSGAVVVWHDITERNQAEAALRQLNERLDLTQAAAGVGSWDWDLPSGRLEWSAKMFELFGLDSATTPASFDVWRSVLHPEDREIAEKRIALALEKHAELINEYRVILPDGEIRWISALGKGIYTDQHQPTRMSGICVDITGRKLAEAEVEHLSSFPRLDPNPVLEIDATGTIVFCNPGATRTLERLGLENDPRVFLPNDLAVILQELTQGRECTFQREVQVGSAIFAETVQVIPAFKVMRIYAFDVSRQRRAEESLRSAILQLETEKRHLEAVLETLPVGVIITDAQGGVVLTNGMDEQIWGPRPITRDVSDYAQYTAWWADSGKPVEPHEWASAQAVEKGEPVFRQVLEIQRFDGERGFILNSAVPVRDRDGLVTGSAVAIQDITELRLAEQALRKSEEKYRLLFQNMAEGFALYELLYDDQGQPADWRILEVNDAYARNTGLASERIVGRRISELFPAAIPEYLPRFAEVVSTQAFSTFETFAKSVGRYQHVVTFPAGDARFASIIEDITDRKRAEAALRASEEKFATVFRVSPVGFAIAKATDGTLLDINEAFTTSLGYGRLEVVGTRVEDVDLVPSSDALSRLVQLFLEQGQVVDHELELRTKGGENATMLVSLAAVKVRDEACILAVAHDITGRKRVEEMLRRTDAALALASHQRGRLEERQRLARELHDSVSQALYGISLGAHTALTELDTNPSAVREALNYVLSLTQAGLNEMRAVIFDLRPESLEREGLVVALTKQTAALVAGHDVKIELMLCDEPAVPLSAKEAFYRIAQEALQNAVKHARADRLEVHLTCEPDGLALEVFDNGTGFDAQAHYPGHLGLHSMRERATEIGGTLEIFSAPDRGTRVRAHAPIARAAPSAGDAPSRDPIEIGP